MRLGKFGFDLLEFAFGVIAGLPGGAEALGDRFDLLANRIQLLARRAFILLGDACWRINERQQEYPCHMPASAHYLK
jgi:hypothetical protein